MKERIKKLRKYFDLTQKSFGERIGVKGNTVAQYEMGRNEPIDSVFSLICREFNVREEWLRTGEGEMFKSTTRDDETAACIARILSDNEKPLKANFLNFAAKIIDDDDCYNILESKLLELAELVHKKRTE